MSAIPIRAPGLPGAWWVLALRGALALAFGILAVAVPGPTVVGLVALFAAYALLLGLVYLAGLLRHRRHARGPRAVDWWMLLLLALACIAAGVLTALRPSLAALALVVVIGINTIVTGVLEMVLAIRMRDDIRAGVWLLMPSALASIVFGTILVTAPGIGALALVWLIGVYALAMGMLYFAMAYRAYRACHPRGDARPATRQEHGERRLRERRAAPAVPQ